MGDKHAYLIMAHNQVEHLKCLLEALDHHDNDIYLHLDRKMTGYNVKDFYEKVKAGNLCIMPEKLDVRWGCYSQIACELYLLSEAIKTNHTYYHLMSGVDFPLKSQEEIHRFFEKNQGTEFIHFEAKMVDDDTKVRVSKYHFWIEKSKGSVLKKILRKLLLLAQKPIDRTKHQYVIYQKGANWFSITDSLARYVIDQKKEIYRLFKYTLCGDEMFLQTIVYNSDFREKVCENNYCDNYENIQYCIDWKRGKPYEFREADYEMLINSGMLFARKFNWEKDNVVVLNLLKNICPGKEKNEFYS